jgi:hypothetical protein
VALYRGYAETRLGAGPTRRFLLDLDLTALNKALDFEPTGPVNYLDMNANGTPDVRVQVIMRRFTLPTQTVPPSDTFVEIRLRPRDGAILTQAEVRVYLDTTQNVSPVPPAAGADATVSPSGFAYLGYIGATGEVMPPLIRATLRQQALPTVLGPVDQTDVQVFTPLDVPRRFDGGVLTGPVVLAPAVATSFTAGAYSETTPSNCRTADPASPEATLASLKITDPAAAAAQADVQVQVRIPHRAAPPTAAPTAARAGAGAGNVSRGGHRYKVTYVLQNGNETGASPASGLVQIDDPAVDGKVTVSNLPVGPAPPANDPGLAVTRRRIYRSLASPTGESGEYFRLGEVANNNPGQTYPDNTADRPAGPSSLPGSTVTDALSVRYDADRVVHIDGGIGLRTGGVEDDFVASLRSVPTHVDVSYITVPLVAGWPRVRWSANDVLRSAQVVSPTLRGGLYAWLEARARDVPKELGVDWSTQGAARTRVELGGADVGTPAATPVGDLAVVLANSPRPWRDVPQTACVEMVEVRRSDQALVKARLRLALRGLLRARVALGEQGTNAAWDDGIKVELALGPDLLGRQGRERLPERALRLLRLNDTYPAGVRDHSQLSVRAGVLPDLLTLDLRSSPAPAGRPDGESFLGLSLRGPVGRIKVLSLSKPAAGMEAWAAGGLRLWLAVPQTAKELDVVRAGGDTRVRSDRELFAELTVRDPTGIGAAGGGEPLRLVKGGLAIPRQLLAAPALAFVDGVGSSPMRVAYSTARAGSSATNVIAGDGLPFPAAWVGASIRFVGGGLSGQRRTITGVTAGPPGAAAQTGAFSAAPAAGDVFVVERFDGSNASSGFGGLTLEAGSGILGPTVSGRIGLSKDLDSGAEVGARATDRLVATGATPQFKLRSTPPSGMRALTARVIGVRRLNVTTQDSGALAAHVALDPDRVNKAFRAQTRELDARFASDERDALKVRISELPDDVMIRTDVAPDPDDPSAGSGLAVIEARLSAATGEGSLWSEPSQMRDPLAGSRAGEIAGIGLLELAFDGLPRAARASLLRKSPPGVPATDLVPHNWTPPAGWITSGVKAELCETIDLHFVRSIAWGADRPIKGSDIPPFTGVVLEPDGLISLWSRTDITFLTIAQQAPASASDPPRLDPLIIWQPQERPPANPFEAKGGLGFLIDPGLRITLDVDSMVKKTLARSGRWDGLSDALGNWDLMQEFQMKDYQGEVTVSSPLGLSPAGDPNAGPGQWFLRVLNGLDSWPAVLIGFGSAYFGNTGGTFFTRPRIYS